MVVDLGYKKAEHGLAQPLLPGESDVLLLVRVITSLKVEPDILPELQLIFGLQKSVPFCFVMFVWVC